MWFSVDLTEAVNQEHNINLDPTGHVTLCRCCFDPRKEFLETCIGLNFNTDLSSEKVYAMTGVSIFDLMSFRLKIGFEVLGVLKTSDDR